MLAVTQDRIIGTENLQPQPNLQQQPQVEPQVVLREATIGNVIKALSQEPQAQPSKAGAARISQLEESLS